MRKPRELREGASYHVIMTTGSRPWIDVDRCDGLLLGILSRAKEKYGFILEGYALMDNRVDLVIRPLEGESLSVIMRWIAGVFAAACNREMGMDGRRLWADRFRSEILGGAKAGPGPADLCAAEGPAAEGPLAGMRAAKGNPAAASGSLAADLSRPPG